MDRRKPCKLCGQRHASKSRSRTKGKVAERKVATAYREAGFEARRSIQSRGAAESDVVALCFWNEVKDRKTVSCRTTWEQARDDAKNDTIPLAITHEPRSEWLVTLQLEDWLAILTGMQMNAEALREAQAHVFRQAHHGRHEQDRWDAYVWWQKWGTGSKIHPVPKEPKPPKKRRG